MTLRALLCAAMLLPMSAFGDSALTAEAWIPAAPPMSMSHAAYVTLQNADTVPRVLTTVSSEIYGMAHLHESKETAGMATMAMLHQIEIPAGGTLTMEPGALHVMLMHPKTTVVAGDRVALTLTFANGEVVLVDAIVKAGGYGS